MKFILYALILFLVIQMIRTTMRIRGNVRKGDDDDEREKSRPPVVNIPDIEDATFEDISDQLGREQKKSGNGGPTSSSNSTPPR